MTAWHIIDNCALLPFDAERHDPNTTMRAFKQAGEPDPIYFNNIIEARVKITSIIIKINFYIIYKREGVAPGGHFGQPVPIAMHPPIGQVMPFQPMCGNWHGLAKKAAKNNSSGQVFCAMVGATSVCFVVVLWLLYDAQYVEYTTPTTPKPSETSPLSILRDVTTPGRQAHVKHHLKEMMFHIC